MGIRYYDESDVREILNLTPLDKRKTVVYCRVSSYGQKDDLASQVAAMETYCLNKGIAVDEWVEEGYQLKLGQPLNSTAY